MIVSINQPAYLPWLGYFHRIAMSDLHIVLDHVQFEKNSFTNRNKVRASDACCWLTVPVKTKGRFGDLPIRWLEIDNSTDWPRKHWKTLSQFYGKAPYFHQHAAFFEWIYGRQWYHLSELCRETTQYLLEALGITTQLLFSLEMNPHGAKDELLLDLCRKVDATVYLSGVLGRDYLREEVFEQHGIRVEYQSYRHPEYSQYRAQRFEPYLSIVDLLFNCGPQSLDILMGEVQAPHEASIR